jgi:nickel/cobalt exporter
MRALIRPASVGIVAVLLGAGAWLWLGGMDDLARWAATAQREVQNGIARALRGLRAGDPAALTALLSVCFAYGFFHAVGPGHGKLVVGGYGVAENVPLGRLSSIALAGSLMQAVSAIALVAFGVWALGLTRTQMTDAGDFWLAPASLAAIALVGLWLVIRGLRRLARKPAAHGHTHSGDDKACSTCGHAHGPDPAQVAKANSWGASLALIAAIGIRPCTGALFLLILGWGMGLHWAAIAGTLAMALGTASVTLAVAGSAVLFRESLARSIGDGQAAARLASVIEISAGALVAIIATGLLLRLL